MLIIFMPSTKLRRRKGANESEHIQRNEEGRRERQTIDGNSPDGYSDQKIVDAMLMLIRLNTNILKNYT
jgi:hypothetical protein